MSDGQTLIGELTNSILIPAGVSLVTTLITLKITDRLERENLVVESTAAQIKELIADAESIVRDVGLVSHPGRAWGCTVLLENGAVYRALPPHALAFSEQAEPDWTVRDCQHWDCYGTDFAVIEYEYLRGLDCLARCNRYHSAQKTEELPGTYLFSVCPVNDGFSDVPEQAKEFTFVRLDNGRLTIQPTDRIVFREVSFTGSALAFPKGLKRQDQTWSVE